MWLNVNTPPDTLLLADDQTTESFVSIKQNKQNTYSEIIYTETK